MVSSLDVESSLITFRVLLFSLRVSCHLSLSGDAYWSLQLGLGLRPRLETKVFGSPLLDQGFYIPLKDLTIICAMTYAAVVSTILIVVGPHARTDFCGSAGDVESLFSISVKMTEISWFNGVYV